jgi:glycosyltransferase involved in cell wall biosynthesis
MNLNVSVHVGSHSDTSVIKQGRLAGKRVAVIMYSTYPTDPRPRRAAEALVKEGASVEVICLKETDEESQQGFFNGVNITRVPIKHQRGGKISYLVRYGSFIMLCAVILVYRVLKQRYHLVHVHNMPDVLVLSALAPKVLGAKVILDLHDPMPELMATIFGLRENNYSVRLLKQLEKWSMRFADSVVVVNESNKCLFSARSCPPGKITVVMNSPDETIFRHPQASKPTAAARDTLTPFVIMYHGLLVERHGLDLAVEALQKIRGSIPGAELRIYGRSTPFLKQVMSYVENSGLCEAVRYLGPKTLEQIPQAILECQVGVIPNHRSIFTELNTPTRIFEFLAMGKPVIAPRSQGIMDYFGPGELLFFELGDANDLAVKIEYAFKHSAETAEIVERGQEVYRSHKWSTQRMRFVNLAGRLLT